MKDGGRPPGSAFGGLDVLVNNAGFSHRTMNRWKVGEVRIACAVESETPWDGTMTGRIVRAGDSYRFARA